jgi:flap endonuclease-1
MFRSITPEMIESDQMLNALEITREQLVRRHGTIERMPGAIREELAEKASKVRDLYHRPDVRDDYSVQPGRCDVEGVVRYLCEERAFSDKRVLAALQRAFPSAAVSSPNAFVAAHETRRPP